jgi:hypothetical protein
VRLIVFSVLKSQLGDRAPVDNPFTVRPCNCTITPESMASREKNGTTLCVWRPECYLCTLDPSNCTIYWQAEGFKTTTVLVLGRGSAEGVDQEGAGHNASQMDLVAELSADDRRATLDLYRQLQHLQDFNPNTEWPWEFKPTWIPFQNIKPDPDENTNVASVAISLAVVLIAVYVHREVARAHTLARLVLTHTGCMPLLHAPLSVVEPLVPRMPWRGHYLAVLALLLLPCMQLLTALAVLFAASTVFALAEDETSAITSIIFNSVALLFVLELDNVLGGLAKERRRTVDTAGPPVNDLAAAEAPASPAATLAPVQLRVLGHFYIAFLGLLALAELLCATSLLPTIFVTKAYKGPDVEGIAPTINKFRNNAVAGATFMPLYVLVVALLFDPPLPPAKNTLWTLVSKCYFILCAANLAPWFLRTELTTADGQAGRILGGATIVWLLILCVRLLSPQVF